MVKHKIIEQISNTGIIAVVRAENEKKAIKIVDACVAGGVNIIEITFTVPHADTIISQLADNFKKEDVLLGAGTVLDSETARLAILNGAQFIVSPGFNLDTAKLCNRYQIPYIPGCITITEIITAMEAGSEVVKIFPGSLVGPSYIKAIKGPLPQVSIIPTGGVNLDNIEEWLNNGCIAVGVGSTLTGPAKNENYQEITNLAKQFTTKIKKIKK